MASNASLITDEHAPAGLTIDDLDLLGPIFVLRAKLSPKTFGWRLVTEMWPYRDCSRIVELSTNCLPGEGLDVAEAGREFLVSKDANGADRGAA